MEEDMKEIGKMDLNVDKDRVFILMGINIKESGRRESRMVKDV
jgi:hypothetical protein